MSVLEIIGYFGALIIGITLGLFGGGGSILAIPILTYLFLLDEKIATAYSLFIIGSTSVFGAIRNSLKELVSLKYVFLFGIPATIGVSVIRHYIIPILPDVIWTMGDFYILNRRVLMLGFFAILMIPAAISMIKGRRDVYRPKKTTNTGAVIIILQGFLIGCITGFVGAGGGFLIIPALVILARLDIKRAVATSLMIITITSLVGFFLGDFLTTTIDWNFLLKFSALAVVGIFIGTFLSTKIDGQKLKQSFGYFILVMAVFIFYMEFFVKNVN